MLRLTRLLFAALIATIAMGAAAATGSASTGASVTNGVTLATANGVLTLTAGGITERCDVTLGFTLHQSIAKTHLALIGTVQPTGQGTTNITNCDLSLSVTVLPDIHVGYISFLGELPIIEGILGRANNARFLLQLPGLSCLYTGEVPVLFERNTFTGEVEFVNLDAQESLFVDNTEQCPDPGSLVGSLTVLSPVPVIELI